jgi:hypothetical protein
MVDRIVAMPAIPSSEERGSKARADLSYAEYGRKTWEWWCKEKGFQFVFLNQPIGDGIYNQMSPTFRRWLAVEMLFRQYGKDARIALVDADTMIRWDCPDLFLVAGSLFAAARDINYPWIRREIAAYQALFPGVFLPWWNYFNAGIVVLGDTQLPTINFFLEFLTERWTRIDAIQRSGDYGTDQTPLNFVVSATKEPVNFLPPAFNVLHCFPMNHLLRVLERQTNPDWEFFADHAFSRPNAFDFVERGFIWHFTNVIQSRRFVMGETWRRFRFHYK